MSKHPYAEHPYVEQPYDEHPDWAADARDIETRENTTPCAECNAIAYVGRDNGLDGFTVTHRYPTIAHAVLPIAWHYVGAESLCMPALGVQLQYLVDGSVEASIHIAAGAQLNPGCYNFLSGMPQADAFGMNAEIMSEQRRIALIALGEHWPRILHVAERLRDALLAGQTWVLPSPVPACEDIGAYRAMASDAGRARAVKVRQSGGKYEQAY